MKNYFPFVFIAALTLAGCGRAAQTLPEESSAEAVTSAPETEEAMAAEALTEPLTEPSTEPVTEPPSPVGTMLDGMSLHEKVCQMFIVKPEGLTGYDLYTYADDLTYTCYEQYPVGGFIFFANNIISSEQTLAMTGDLQQMAMSRGTGAFIAVDEEGGYVTRVQMKLGTEAVSSMSWYGSLNDYDSAFGAGQTIGDYLAYYGFNVDFAPVADVNINPNNELGSRIFSSDPDITANMSAAVVDGLHQAGVCSTLKHFPGLGAGGGNTHYETVVIDRTYEQLCETEFRAFSGGINAGSDFVMVGHQITTGAGDSMPGDLSPTVVTQWLKNELGYSGLVITDSHSMGAIVNVYGSAEAAVLAVEAGIDVILMPNDLSAAVDGIEQAVGSGRISEERIDESVLKILEKKEQMGLLSPPGTYSY